MARFELARPRGIPEQIYQHVLGNIRELNRRDKLDTIAYQNWAVQTNDAFLDRFQSIIGAQNMTKYNALRRQNMKEMQDSINNLPKSERTEEKLAKIRLAQVRKSITQIKAMGVDIAKVRQLWKEFQKVKEARLGDYPLKKKGGRGPPTPRPENREITKAKPPFDGWLGKYNEQIGYTGGLHDLMDQQMGSKIVGPLKVTPDTGNIVCNQSIFVKNADVDDYLVIAAGAVLKWFKMPAGDMFASLPTVRVRAKLATKEKTPHVTGYAGHVDAFFGASAAGVHQQVDLYARIHLPTGPTPPIFRNILDYNMSTWVDYDWNNPMNLDFSWVGDWIGPTPFSGFFTEKGVPVLVEVGIHYINHFVAYNAEVVSSLQGAVNIEEIGLTATTEYKFD